MPGNRVEPYFIKLSVNNLIDKPINTKNDIVLNSLAIIITLDNSHTVPDRL